jgi:hypothetical protein
MSRYSNTKKKRTKRKLTKRKKQKGGVMDITLVNTINLFFNDNREFLNLYLRNEPGSTFNKSEQEQFDILEGLNRDIRRNPIDPRWKSIINYPNFRTQIGEWLATLKHYKGRRQLAKHSPQKVKSSQSPPIEKLKIEIERLNEENKKLEEQLVEDYEKEEKIVKLEELNEKWQAAYRERTGQLGLANKEKKRLQIE